MWKEKEEPGKKERESYRGRDKVMGRRDVEGSKRYWKSCYWKCERRIRFPFFFSLPFLGLLGGMGNFRQEMGTGKSRLLRIGSTAYSLTGCRKSSVFKRRQKNTMKILLPGTDALEEGNIDEEGTDISKYLRRNTSYRKLNSFRDIWTHSNILEHLVWNVLKRLIQWHILLWVILNILYAVYAKILMKIYTWVTDTEKRYHE